MTPRSRSWILLLGSLIAARLTFAQDAPPVSSYPDKASLTYDLALTLKMLADEQFLLNQKPDAEKTYERAEAELHAIPETGNSKIRVNIELLRTDIAYRKLLLSQNLDFWGSTFSLSAYTPRYHLEQLEGYVKNLSETGTQIESDIDRIASDTTKVANLKAMEEEVDGKISTSTIQVQRAGEIEAFNQKRIGELKDRLTQIRSQQDFYAKKAQEAAEKLKQLEDTTNGLILSGISSLSGLPVDVSKLGKGDFADQAKVIAIGMIEKSPALHDAIAHVADEGSTIGGLLQNAESIQKKIEEGQATLGHVSDLIRQPTLQGFLSVGQEVFPNLPSDLQKQLLQQVQNAKPLIPLVQLTQKSQDIRAAVVGLIQEKTGELTSVQSTTDLLLKQGRGDLLTWYKGILTEAGRNLPSTRIEFLSSAVFRMWPHQFLDQLNKTKRDALLQKFNVPSEEDLISALLAQERLPVTIVEGNLALKDVNCGRSLLDFIQSIDVDGNAAYVEDEAKKQIGLVLTQLNSESANFSSMLWNTIPPNLLEAKLTQLNGLSNEAQIFSAVVEHLGSPAKKEAVFKDLAQTTLGSLVSSGVLSDPHNAVLSSKTQFNSVPGGVLQDGAKAGSKQNQILLGLATGPLGAAFPPAAAAGTVAKIVGNWISMNSEVDKINAASSEIKSLIVEELHLHDILEEAHLNVALAQYDERIAQLGGQVAFAERDAYRSGVRNQVSKMNQSRARASYRAELFFYWNEMLRYEFDSLDRALGLWVGEGGSLRGELTKRIKNDPENVRLALDLQVNLFDWLDRGVESQRENIDAVIVHWREIFELSRKVCLEQGCAAGAPTLPEVQTTDTLRLKNLVSPDVWKSFEEWQKNPNGKDFAFWVLLHPSLNLTSPNHINPRIVDVRLAALDAKDHEALLTKFRLFHPGVSYIPYRDGFRVDVLAPISVSSLFGPSGLNEQAIKDLKQAWIRRDPSPRASNFDGYGIYTEWRLTLEPNATNQELRDILLRFAYRYVPRVAGTQSALDVPSAKFATPQPITITQEQLRTLGSAEDIHKKLERWRANPAEGLPKLGFAVELIQ